MYAADYDGILPRNAWGYKWWTRTSVLGPYLSTDSKGTIWHCPVQEGGGGGGTAAATWPRNNWHGLCVQTFYSGWGLSWTGFSLAEFQRPTEMITVADGIGGGYNSATEDSNNEIYPGYFSRYWTPPCIWPNPTTCSYPEAYKGLTNDPPYWPATTAGKYPQGSSFVGRHFGKCNCAFIDGHVAPMDVATIPTSLNIQIWPTNIYRYLQHGSNGE